MVARFLPRRSDRRSCVLALDVLDQRHLRHFGVGGRAHVCGHGYEAGPGGGAPAAFAGYDLIAASGHRAQRQRLHYAKLADTGRKLLERLRVERAARLLGVRLYQVQFYFGYCRCASGLHLGHRSRRKQRVESATQRTLRSGCLLILIHCHGHAFFLRLRSRDCSSRASWP